MNKIQALFMGFATAAGAGGIAAYNGLFDSPVEPAAEIGQANPAKIVETPVEVAKIDPAASPSGTEAVQPAATAVAPAASPAVETVPPVFGLLRAEPDGSLLVAGQGAPGSEIELLSAANLLGKTKAEANGDFAIVLSDPLKPGDYSLVLRATNPDGKSATSVETAIVSIPDQPNGQVLALVEEPGKPSRIITTPEAAKPEEVAAVTAEPSPAAPAGQEAKPADPAEAAVAPAAAPEATPATEPEAPAAEPAKTEAAVAEPAMTEAPAVALVPEIVVEAVEIEGRKIFVAGKADKGATVRLYANDVLLGDAVADDSGRFLLETERDLPVGDYIVKADSLDADGVTVLARAAVPFKREEGEAVAAVAAPSPQAPAPAPEVSVAASEPQQTAPAAPETQAAETTAPALTKVDSSVIIRRGDTLWQISRRVYGRGIRYSTIYLANKDQVVDPNMIWPGQVMMIPEKTVEGEAADMAEIEKRKSEAKN